MRAEEKTRREIEDKILRMGDYVKIDYLNRCLKSNIDFETRRFVLLKLSALYDNKKMFFDAGRMIKAAAEINTTFKGKMDDFLKSAEFFIKGGNYDQAESAVKNAISIGTEREKNEIKIKAKEIYFVHAKNLVSNDRRKQAAEIYERILRLEINDDEKRDAQTQLMNLYDKLGRVRDYYMLKKQIK